jgi:hypothetical protein
MVASSPVMLNSFQHKSSGDPSLTALILKQVQDDGKGEVRG